MATAADYTVAIYNIEDRIPGKTGKDKFKKLSPNSSFPPLPKGGKDVVLVTSGRVPHWRHALAMLNAIDSDQFGAVAVRDPIIEGAVVVESIVEGLSVGDVIPV